MEPTPEDKPDDYRAITHRIFNAAGAALTTVGGGMLAVIPRPDLSLGGASIALCGLILTDLSFKGKLGVNWLMEKCNLTTSTALGSLSLAACAFLGGGEMIDIIRRGEVLNVFQPGYLKVIANAIPYTAASAISFKSVRAWLENPENDKAVTDAYRQARDKAEEVAGKPLAELTDDDYEKIRQRDRKWLKQLKGSGIDATQLGLFALGNAMISGYGALAGNSAREIGAILFSGNIASLIALAKRPGKSAAGLRGPISLLEVRAYDANASVEDVISYEYFKRIQELGRAIAKELKIDPKAYGELLMNRIEQHLAEPAMPGSRTTI